MKNEYNVSFVGSGNVAYQLALALSQSGHQVLEVYSNSFDNAQELALKTNSKAISNIKDLSSQTDFIIIAVSDDMVKYVSNEIENSNATVCHTSGSTDLNALKKHENHGVFYPLQTLSKSEKENFNNIPILIEANSENTLKEIEHLAKSISENVSGLNSSQRKSLHLSAVIANNFTNHIFTLLVKYCEQNNINFELLKPLIEKTFKSSHPQTGPAKRGDQKVIYEHLEMLEDNPELKDLYENISNNISNYYGN